jgi:putative hemolysin
MMTNTTQTATQNDTIYIYREAESQEELEELLKLRYRAFANTKGVFSRTAQEKEYGIELDEFDAFSQHFGLFSQENSVKKPIGYVRLIGEKETKFSNWINSEKISKTKDWCKRKYLWISKN